MTFRIKIIKIDIFIKAFLSLAKANLALKVRKTNPKFSANNFDLVKKSYTIFLLLDLVNKNFTKFLDLVILTYTGSITEGSIYIVFSIEISEIGIWLEF